MHSTPVPSIADEFGLLAAALETVASVIEIFAIIVLLNGLVRFVIAYAGAEMRFRDAAASADRMNGGRIDLSRYILAGLEVFIVSDIIRTVLTPTLESLSRARGAGADPVGDQLFPRARGARNRTESQRATDAAVRPCYCRAFAGGTR